MQQRYRVIYYKVGQDFAQMWAETEDRDTALAMMYKLAAISDVAGAYIYDGTQRERIIWVGELPEVFYR